MKHNKNFHLFKVFIHTLSVIILFSFHSCFTPDIFYDDIPIPESSIIPQNLKIIILPPVIESKKVGGHGSIAGTMGQNNYVDQSETDEHSFESHLATILADKGFVPITAVEHDEQLNRQIKDCQRRISRNPDILTSTYKLGKNRDDIITQMHELQKLTNADLLCFFYSFVEAGTLPDPTIFAATGSGTSTTESKAVIISLETCQILWGKKAFTRDLLSGKSIEKIWIDLISLYN